MPNSMTAQEGAPTVAPAAARAPAPPGRAEDVIREIFEGTAAATGDEFFRSLVQHLARALGFRFAFVAELVPPDAGDGNGAEPRSARTLAVWAGDRFVDNFEYPLLGSPCERVTSEREICRHLSRAAAAFPRDELLVQFGVESYIGAPLVDSADRALGLLSVMHDGPAEDWPHTESIMRIFSARASAELERQHKERALRASERRYQSLADALPVGIFHADLAGNNTYSNARAMEITGVSAAESAGGGWARYLHPDDRDRVFAEWAQSQAAGPARFQSEYRFVHPDGRVVWTLGQILPEYDADGRLIGYVGTSTDITDRKRVELELRNSEQRYQALAESAAVGIWQMTPAGQTLYLNPAMRAMLELEPGELLPPRRFDHYYSPESR